MRGNADFLSFGVRRVGPPWLDRQDLLNVHVMLPAVGEVVLVQEALANTKAKLGQVYVSGIVTEADPAVRADAVLTAVDDEAVQMLVAPAKDELERREQVGNGAVAANEQAAPDQRADTTQDDARLIHHRLMVRGRHKHCAIMTPAAISPVAPSHGSVHSPGPGRRNQARTP
jgi:hypothetical protein